MTISKSLLGGLVVLTAMTGAMAETPAKAPAPAPASTPAATNAAPTAPEPVAAAPTPAPAPASTLFADYLTDLTDTLKLSDMEKKAIESYYVADGALTKNILNNDTLSPLEQAGKVSELREVRNTKIEALLVDRVRDQEFLKVEAKYRVALVLLAADGGLVALPAPPPAKK